MRWIGIAVIVAYGSAHADTQIATDDAKPAAAQLATAGNCERKLHLIGHEPGVVAAIMKERKLRPITLERITLPSDVAVAAVAPNLMTTVRIGNRDVHGIYSNIAGDGCISADIRHGIDANGNLVQLDGPPGVVDYTHGRCHTARGWEPCNLRGVTNVLYVVPNPKTKLIGIVGSELRFYPTTN
jgi:hypothetical protein